MASHFIFSHNRKYTPASAAYLSVFVWFIACYCSVFYDKAKVEGHKMGVNSSSQTSNDFELKQETIINTPTYPHTQKKNSMH